MNRPSNTRVRRILTSVAVITSICLLGATSHSIHEQQPPTLRSGVELLIVDAQVIDRKGVPFTSLKPEDFEVTLDGKKRRVVSADLVRYDVVGKTAEPAPSSSTFTQKAVSEGRRFILAIDEHSFRPGAARAAMQAAGRFVDGLADHDLVGLYAYPAGAAQVDITTDHTAVRQKLERVVGLLDPPMSTFNLSKSEITDISSGDQEALNRVAARECSSGGSSCRKGIQADAIALAGFMEMQIAQSLQGLRGLIRGFAELEGRKTLVLISGGLFASDRSGGRVNMGSEIRELGREAAASNITVYVLHMDSSFIDAFSARRTATATLFRDSNALAGGLELVAGAAGGAVIRVQGGTGDYAFERVLRENSAYYVLGVELEPVDRDGEPHMIKVRVRKGGLTVRSRSTVIVPRTPKP